ncbi:ATP-binding protein [Candidatus Collierbacteria bacterium]|nr:ATP-binding protein [Candidatus Collierbacteria bacterium]
MDNPTHEQISNVQDTIAPPAIEVDFSHLKIGDTYLRTLFVVGYPRYVSANWLSPLINFNHSLDIAMYIYPTDSKGTLEQLRRRTAEMEAEISTDIQRGRIPHAATQAALEDVKSLQDQLVKGIERFFQFSLYVTIAADSVKELNTITQQVQSTLGSLLILAKVASLSMEDAFKTTLPYSKDKLVVTRNMDTTALSTTFPFTSSELSDNKGILYGVNAHNESLVIFDRFSLENANMLVLATSGAGKSVTYSDEVIIKNAANEVKRTQIGPLIEKIIQRKGSIKLEKDIEGNINPGIKVYSFDPKTLRGGWSSVTVAARKKSPKNLYHFITKSGREITTTADHNLLTLKDTKINVSKGSLVKIGDHLPLPRQLPESISSTSKHSLEYYALLGYYTAEGCFTKTAVYIANTHPQTINLLINLCEKLKLRYHLNTYTDKKTVHAVVINSKSLIRKLKLEKCAGKAGTKRAPSILFAEKNELKAAYLRSYFSGDGCVENHEVTCTTKSKGLASDLSYLLYNFGIIARIHPKFKRATNSGHTGDTYHQLTISGQDNLRKFAAQVGFNLDYKNNKLQKLLGKTGNANVDVIPNLQKIFGQLYHTLYGTENGAPQRLIEIKNGSYQPTPKEILRLIEEIRPRITEIENEKENIFALLKLPQWQDLALEGAAKKSLNKKLWQNFGHTWQTMKARSVAPQINTVLNVYQTIHGPIYTKEHIYSTINSSFKKLGLSLQDFDNTLWNAVTQTNANTIYDRVYRAGQHLFREYLKLQDKIKEVESLLSDLSTLAKSDLFWDPIVKIERVKSEHPYVYDLTVNNQVFLAGHGGMFVHNSYFVKLEILRSLMFDTESIILDPENEYEMIAKAVGGNYISFSSSSTNKINPFQLANVNDSTEDEMGYKYLFLQSLLKIMLGQMSPTEDATLNRALVLTYRQKGITEDPATHTLEAPRMEDLYRSLIGMEDENAKNLSARLEKYVMGAVKGIFDQQSNISLDSKVTVFTLRELADEIRPIVMFIILDYVWTKIRTDLKRRLLIVDEAWYLMRYEDSAKILQGFVKRARKYYLGVTVISQNADDFLTSPYGKAIVTNSALQLLFKQSPAAVDQVADVFYLSQGEKHMLLSAGVGEGLFFAGQNHVAIRVISSPDEHALATSKPTDILERQKQAAA